MRYQIIIPAAPARREVTHTFKADTEQHARAIIRCWLGHQAAMEAIVRPVKGETLEQTVNRKAGA